MECLVILLSCVFYSFCGWDCYLLRLFLIRNMAVYPPLPLRHAKDTAGKSAEARPPANQNRGWLPPASFSEFWLAVVRPPCQIMTDESQKSLIRKVILIGWNGRGKSSYWLLLCFSYFLFLSRRRREERSFIFWKRLEAEMRRRKGKERFAHNLISPIDQLQIRSRILHGGKGANGI